MPKQVVEKVTEGTINAGRDKLIAAFTEPRLLDAEVSAFQRNFDEYKGGLEPGRYVSFIANYIVPLKKHGYIVEYGYGDQPLKSNKEGYIPRSKRKKFYIINKSKVNDLSLIHI